MVYTGRRGLHIFDIDKENWLMSDKRTGYQYEDIYHKVRNINQHNEYGDSQGSDLSEDEEQLLAEGILGPI